MNPSPVLVLGLFVAIALAACQEAPLVTEPASPSAGSNTAPRDSTAPGDDPSATIGVAADFVSGAGELFLDPMEGLDALASHTAILTWSFEGTTDGRPSTWTERTTLRAASDPPVTEVVIERTGIPNEPADVWQALVEDVVYETADGGACSARLPGAASVRFTEPAEDLSAVIGGTQVGTETIDGVAADAFEFDGPAMGLVDPVKATGHAWISPSDELLLRYDVTIDAGPGFLGDGVTGRLMGSYELRDVGGGGGVTIPSTCPAGLIEGPRPTDATEVDTEPGRSSFHTTMAVKAAMAFFTDSSRDFGWSAAGTPKIQAKPDVALLMFTKGDLTITVLIVEDRGGSRVVTTAQRG